MDFNFKLSNTVWNTLVGVGSLLLTRTPLVRKLIVKLMDYFAKPLYDWSVRKGFMKVETIKAKKAQDTLKNTTTIEDAKKAVNDIP